MSKLISAAKKSIKVSVGPKDGNLISEKDFFILEDISISLDINLTDNKHIINLILSEGSKKIFPFYSVIYIHDQNKVLMGKDYIIQKNIKFQESYPKCLFHLPINYDYREKIANLSNNKTISIEFSFEIFIEADLKNKNKTLDINTTTTINKFEKPVVFAKSEKTETKPKTETKIETKIETKQKTETKIETETKPKTEQKIEAKQKTETETKPKIEKKQETEIKPKTETKSEIKSLEKVQKLERKDPSVKTTQSSQINQLINSTQTKKNPNPKDNNELQKKASVSSTSKSAGRTVPYNGIYNQGATCYINSSIQTLFFISYFRDVIFHFTSFTEGSIESELQLLFYNLEKGKSHCSTVKLTKALGMSDRSVHIQQDIQEFLSDFLERIQRNLKDEISYIFEGTTIHFLKSSRGTLLSSSTETFKQLMINVSDSVDTSLKSYFSPEKIENYNVGNETQTVTLESKISVLPRILQIVIKRYKRGLVTNSNIKDNSQVNFKEDLDLLPFVDRRNASSQNCTKYKLYAVIAHSGTLSSGHYTVFLKPEMKDVWFYFSDSLIRKSSPHEAIEMNFGSANNRSAYILVYARIDSIQEMFKRNYQIPDNLMKLAEREQQRESIVMKSDPSYLIDFQIFNELCLVENCEKNFMSFHNPDFELNISVNLRSEVDCIYENISKKTKIDTTRLRLWTISSDGVHLDKVITPMDQVDELDNQKLFLEIKNEDEMIQTIETKIYFLFLYTRSMKRPLLFLHTVHYDPSPLKYESIVDDGMSIIIQNTNINCINKSLVSVYVYDSNKVVKKLQTQFCVEENGSMIILEIAEEINDSIIDRIEYNIRVNKKLNLLRNNRQIKQQKSTEIIFNYFDFMAKYMPDSFDNFYQTRNNMKHVKVYNFDDIKQKVGVIDVPSSIQYQQLVQFINVMFEPGNSSNDPNSVCLLFGHDSDLDAPRSKPFELSSSPFKIEKSLDTIYYTIVSKSYASDPTSKTRIVQLSKNGYSLGKIVCYYWPESLIHPFKQFYLFNESFFKENNQLENRLFIVDKNKEIFFFNDDKDLSFDNKNVLRIEKVMLGQIGKKLIVLQEATIGIHDRIQKLGNPFFFPYIDNENVSQFRSRLCTFLGYDLGYFQIHPKKNFFHKGSVMKEKVHLQKWDDQNTIYLIFD